MNSNIKVTQDNDGWPIEKQEWLESLFALQREHGNEKVRELLRALQNQALKAGISLEEATLNTPYRNTIPVQKQPAYPGNIELEQRIEDIHRWNAMAMVLQAYDSGTGVGGHIATYASAATMMEVGAMATFLAAGTAYAHFGVPTIPFYIFYSMFGFQRVGDMIWACGDSMCRGFLVGGTAGRTTLNGEGLQHEDGHSQVTANTVPNLLSYDPAFSCELAVIIREGIRRMYTEQEDVFYYLTVYNENYPQPALTEGAEDGNLKGIYRFREAAAGGAS